MTTITKLMNLGGRRALITGAAGHVGRIAAQTLAELGADLVLVDRPGADFGPLAADIGNAWRVKTEIVECDLEAEAARAQLVEKVRGQAAGLDILINNAAFAAPPDLKGWGTDFENQTVEAWRKALEVNLTAAFDLAKGLTPLLKRNGHGSIINMASIYGSYGPDFRLYEGTDMVNPAGYAASKGGLIQLTRWLATTLAPHIRANTIAPGGIFRNQPAAFVERYTARTPLGRMATEDDLRGAIAYLASDMSLYVTGQNLAVDGGWGVW